MSLIRCLGPVKLPRSYRSWMNKEVELYRRKREIYYTNPFAQQYVPNPASERYDYYRTYRHEIGGEAIIVTAPDISQDLINRFKGVCRQPQSHLYMTLVEVEMHRDDDTFLMDRSILVIHEASPLHFLRVEDEHRQLMPGMAYTFNQKREHGLVYNDECGSTSRSKPLSAINISFESPKQLPSRYY